VTALKAMGFQASHDTQYGGHCDVVIEGKCDFLWIAEAKIHSSYDWLLSGFEQLDQRYSTGLPGQDAGEIIIYCFGARLDRVMSEWETRLVGARPDVSIDRSVTEPLLRRSTHTHKATGGKFRIRHKGITLYFNPKV